MLAHVGPPDDRRRYDRVPGSAGHAGSRMRRPVIETARLLLRPFRMSDAADVQRLAGDPAVADTTLNIPHPYGDGLAEEWIASHGPGFEAGRLVNFAITSREDGRLLGAIGLTLAGEERTGELGYWVGVPYWNRGYCTEAAAAVVEYGFAAHALERIHARHLLRNPGSGRVMQKIGMRSEGIVRAVLREGGTPEDLVLYGLLRGHLPRTGRPAVRVSYTEQPGSDGRA